MTAPKKTIRFPLDNTSNRYDDFTVDDDELGKITVGEALILNELRKMNQP